MRPDDVNRAPSLLHSSRSRTGEKSPDNARRRTTPLLDVCHALYAETRALGFGDADMAAVLKTIEARSDPK